MKITRYSLKGRPIGILQDNYVNEIAFWDVYKNQPIVEDYCVAYWRIKYKWWKTLAYIVRRIF